MQVASTACEWSNDAQWSHLFTFGLLITSCIYSFIAWLYTPTPTQRAERRDRAAGLQGGPQNRTTRARTMDGGQSKEKAKEGKGREPESQVRKNQQDPAVPSPRSHKPTYPVQLLPYLEPRDNTGESPRWPPRYSPQHTKSPPAPEVPRNMNIRITDDSEWLQICRDVR